MLAMLFLILVRQHADHKAVVTSSVLKNIEIDHSFLLVTKIQKMQYLNDRHEVSFRGLYVLFIDQIYY